MIAGELVRAMQDWLPYPVYRFVGGPYDGKDLKVDMAKSDNGYTAPEIWRLKPPLPKDFGPNDAFVPCTYRFVCAGGHRNNGHYEFAE